MRSRLEGTWHHGPGSWEEVEQCLREPWELVVDRAQDHLVLRVGDTLRVLECRGTWRARHRRGMHRAGFRSVDLPEARVWLWARTVGQPLSAPATGRASGARPASADRWRERLVIESGLRGQAVHVLRDVLGARCADLAVLQPEPWWLDEDAEQWDEDETWDDEQHA